METPKTFRYARLIRSSNLIPKIIIVFLLFVLLTLLCISLVYSFPIPKGLYIFISLLIIFLIPLISLFPFWPDVQVDDQGLLVENFWKPLRVPWDKIIDVQQVNMMFITNEFWLVRTRALTPFHRFYSFIYSGSFAPGFMIGSRMKDHEILVAEIKQAHRKANNLRHKNA